MKVLICQLNPTIGDFAANQDKILQALDKAIAFGAELVVFPELATCGYPPRDLLEDESFIAANQQVFQQVLEASEGIGVVLGFVESETGAGGRMLFNSAALIENGQLLGIQRKQLLPTYDVFDEWRHFVPGAESKVFPFRGKKLGLSICEDAWNDPRLWLSRRYDRDPIAEQVSRGADLLINIGASPFWLGKARLRRDVLCRHAASHKRWMLFVNQVGGNDELVFDGRSMLINPEGNLVHEVRPFAEELFFADLEVSQQQPTEQKQVDQDDITNLFQALVLGTKDYVNKCGFKKCILGLSGGIDSAVVAALAVEALGPSQVIGVLMPYKYTSEQSLKDAGEIAQRLGIEFQTIPIDPVVAAYLEQLQPHLNDRPADVTEENIQARIRGNILMALSNKFGHLCLSTGNKSELAVGYCTLYGDMVGGLGIISDVPKTMVYQLADYINREREIIPRAVIDKAPSAELREGQKDSDTLPPYEQLDPLLLDYIEGGLSFRQLIEKGHDRQMVEQVLRLVDATEYKRRQMAVGIKVSTRAFGSGRRMPIARATQTK